MSGSLGVVGDLVWKALRFDTKIDLLSLLLRECLRPNNPHQPESTYEGLDIESLGGSNVIVAFFGHGLEDGGLTSVVQTEHKDARFLRLCLQTTKQLKETHFLRL